MSDSLSSRALAKCAELRDSKSLLAGMGAWQALRVVEAVARWKCPMCSGSDSASKAIRAGGCPACKPLRAALEAFTK